MERAELKREIVKLLDAFAVEHPLGHQGNYCGRYHVGSHLNGPLTIVFEKGVNSKTRQPTPPHIWCPIKVVDYVTGVTNELRYAKELWTETNSEGKKKYGRHAGLKVTPELSDVDLVKFTPKTLGEAERVIKGIKKAAADGII